MQAAQTRRLRKGRAPVNGQNGGYRPRTAGERNRPTGNGDDGVRDWQRNTWYGPAPLNTNPFDEPEDAPELKESRSEHVNQHVGDFWKTPDQTFQGKKELWTQTGTGTRPAVKTRKARPRILRVLLALLLVIAAAAVVMRFTLFNVSEILVTGNKNLSAEEVIRVSGIRRGDSIFSVNEEKVRDRIQSDYRLKFDYVAKEMPGTVILSVREREPCCWLTYCGIMYVMDKNRMVLYESENPAERPADLVEIKGLEVRSNTLVGQYINLGNETQQSVFTEMFLEMKVQGCIDRIADVDLSDTGSILLTTRDGYTVWLGDRSNIHAKIRSLLLVQDQLIMMEKQGGTINVNNPESPIYTP